SELPESKRARKLSHSSRLYFCIADVHFILRGFFATSRANSQSAHGSALGNPQTAPHVGRAGLPAKNPKGTAQMRNYLLGAAALLAFAAPGIASAQTASAYVDASYQSTEVDTPLGDDDGDGWAVGGAAAFGGDRSLGFQVDGQFGTSEFDSGDV